MSFEFRKEYVKDYVAPYGQEIMHGKNTMNPLSGKRQEILKMRLPEIKKIILKQLRQDYILRKSALLIWIGTGLKCSSCL